MQIGTDTKELTIISEEEKIRDLCALYAGGRG